MKQRSVAGTNFVFAGLSLPLKGMHNKDRFKSEIQKTRHTFHYHFTGLSYQNSNLKFNYLRKLNLFAKQFKRPEPIDGFDSLNIF